MHICEIAKTGNQLARESDRVCRDMSEWCFELFLDPCPDLWSISGPDTGTEGEKRGSEESRPRPPSHLGPPHRVKGLFQAKGLA